MSEEESKMMRSIGNSRLWVAFVAFALFLGASGYVPFYKTKFSGQARELVETFAAAGGKVLAWGNAAAFVPPGTRVFATAGECVDFIRREGAGSPR